MSAGGPALSVILPTDTYDTIRNVLGAYRAQTVREQLEIVILTESAAGLGPENGACDGFDAVRIVEVDDLYPLPRTRAAGVRAASAPIVLFAETHAFPDPRHCEALIRAHQGPWAVVAPAMCNANPATTRSWAGLYMDYGPWVDAREPHVADVDTLPGNNSSCKRSVLLEYGDRLDSMMLSSMRRHADLRARGFQLYIDPEAKTYHLNVTRPLFWLEERFVGGRSFAAGRSRHWSRARRIVYAAGSPLLPVVRLTRVVRYVRRPDRARFVGRMLPALLLRLAVSAVGECLGYGFGAGGALRRVNEMELHKERYVRPADRRDVARLAQGG